MSNVGSIPEVEADEETDRDVLICEDEERRQERKSARQLIEDMREICK